MGAIRGLGAGPVLAGTSAAEELYEYLRANTVEVMILV